tara:strand:- start:4576 stop:4920 length:345 start_codon:yes stop_codon:yes gene_type:complete
MKLNPLFIKACLPVLIGILAVKLIPGIHKEFFKAEYKEPTGIYKAIIPYGDGLVNCKKFNGESYCLDKNDNIPLACRYSKYKKEIPEDKEKCVFLDKLKEEVESKKLSGNDDLQ